MIVGRRIAIERLWDRDTLAEEAKIRWLLWDGVSPIQRPDDTFFTHDETHWVETRLRVAGMGHVDGISGLIQLGLAWESSDAFRSLASVLDSDRLASIAELAYLRESELSSAGQGSLHPVAKVRDQISSRHSEFLERERRKPIRDYFLLARTATDRRNGAWVAYQEARYANRMHPDTHPDFWKAWSEPIFPEPPGPTPSQKLGDLAARHFGIAVAISFAILVLVSVVILKVMDFARQKVPRGV